MAASRRAETATASVSDTTSIRLVLPALVGVAAAYVLWRLATEASTVPPRVVLGIVPIYLAALARDRPAARPPLADGARPPRQRAAARRCSRVSGSPRAPSDRSYRRGRSAASRCAPQLLVASGIPAARAARRGRPRPLARARRQHDRRSALHRRSARARRRLGIGDADHGAASALLGLVMLIAIYVRGVQGRPALVPISTPPLMLVPARWRSRIRDHAARADQALQESAGRASASRAGGRSASRS